MLHNYTTLESSYKPLNLGSIVHADNFKTVGSLSPRDRGMLASSTDFKLHLSPRTKSPSIGPMANLGQSKPLSTLAQNKYSQHALQGHLLSHQQSYGFSLNRTTLADTSFLLSERGDSRLKKQLERDWQQIINDEKKRIKSKERESKSMIMRLNGELKREQDRILAELASQAGIKRKVIACLSYMATELRTQPSGQSTDCRESAVVCKKQRA